MNFRPEIRAQEALLPYLVAAGFQVTRERSVCIDGTRRIFDFMVRPACGGAISNSFAVGEKEVRWIRGERSQLDAAGQRSHPSVIYKKLMVCQRQSSSGRKRSLQ